MAENEEKKPDEKQLEVQNDSEQFIEGQTQNEGEKDSVDKPKPATESAKNSK